MKNNALVGIRNTLPKCLGLGGRFYQGGKIWMETSREYLQSLGYKGPEVEGILKAFPSAAYTPVSELKSLGPAVLQSIAEAVRREMVDALDRAEVNVVMKIPHEHREIAVIAKEGDTFYEIVQAHAEVGRYLECACKGIAACSTCHVLVDPKDFDKLPEPEESELDMLDLAWGANQYSRLGCQLKLTKELDGLSVTIPEQSNNLFS